MWGMDVHMTIVVRTELKSCDHRRTWPESSMVTGTRHVEASMTDSKMISDKQHKKCRMDHCSSVLSAIASSGTVGSPCLCRYWAYRCCILVI